jgi:hypothetical protein
VARHWAAILVNIFEPDVIATTGITRSFALRCRNWLWPIEGLVRRLIIAAAMKLDPSELPKPAAGRPRPASPKIRQPSVAFVVLPSLPGRGLPGQQTNSGTPHTTQPEHRHLVFPGDSLLNLFPRRDKRNARPATRRTLNPLHRRGRRYRWDPDYQGEAENEHTSCLHHFLAHPRPAEPNPPSGRRHASRSSPSWKPPADIPEWTRVERDWERVIPSARLAGRIRALARVLEKPERWIARAARKLSADLSAMIREAPPPRLIKPRLDRSLSGFLEEELAQSQTLLDTS